MSIESEIQSIRDGIKAGKFANEASISQGIVLRLLNALGWPTYDTQIVAPEYSLSGRRVDFAICNPPNKPIAIIEVKHLGQGGGAERQLFEYAFHDGVPLAILTDGKEWNFFLPGEQGDYGERRVYKLDILDRALDESSLRLKRYLLYSSVVSGTAIDSAREDYKNVSKIRQMEAALPKAWAQLVEDEDEMLLEILADRVETICGFKPTPDTVANFLKYFVKRTSESVSTTIPRPQPVVINPQIGNSSTGQTKGPVNNGSDFEHIGFLIDGENYRARNAIDVLKQIFEVLSEKDSEFPERFIKLPIHGRSRRYLARDPNELYPGRPDLCLDCSVQLKSGLWLGTNHSRQSIAKIIQLARETAKPGHGRDIKFNLG